MGIRDPGEKENGEWDNGLGHLARGWIYYYEFERYVPIYKMAIDRVYMKIEKEVCDGTRPLKEGQFKYPHSLNPTWR
jgi:hypothetical protein